MTRIPVTILTGFLGSGKTTILNRLITEPGFGDTAVIVNEFGEAGIDGALVEQADERAFAMSTGCLCCTVRGDVRLTLLRLLDEAERGVGPTFRRVVIETTGLADPAPIIQTFMTNDYLLSRFTLNGVVTLVDAVNGEETLLKFTEGQRQAAVADLLLITKTDLLADLGAQSSVADLQRHLRRLNPNAKMVDPGELTAETLFSLAAFDPSGKAPDVSDWLRFGKTDGHSDRVSDHNHNHDHDHDVNNHGDAASAYCFSATQPIDPWKLEEAIFALQRSFGRDLLRVKGLVEIEGCEDKPRVLHVVGQITSPPRLLDGWPEGVLETRVVMIVSGPGREAASEMLKKFLPNLQAFEGEVD